MTKPEKDYTQRSRLFKWSFRTQTYLLLVLAWVLAPSRHMRENVSDAIVMARFNFFVMDSPAFEAVLIALSAGDVTTPLKTDYLRELPHAKDLSSGAFDRLIRKAERIGIIQRCKLSPNRGAAYINFDRSSYLIHPDMVERAKLQYTTQGAV